MRLDNQNLVLWATGAAALLNLGLGCAMPHPWMAAGGAFGLVYVASRFRGRCLEAPVVEVESPHAPPPRRPPPVRCGEPRDPSDTVGLVQAMLEQGRYALLLRPQIAANLTEELFRQALGDLEQDMALVPDGEVVVGQIEETPDGGPLDEAEAQAGCVFQVERFFLDRYPVTNAQYREFVLAGGYQQAALWDPTILPAVLDFVDLTGQPGPRFWRNGGFAPGREDHPVVGVSWYEAAAYARWLGKRLPTDAEWIKAGSWPVNLSPTTRLQRRYPWGDAMDRARANLWGSGPRDTVAVHAMPGGVSVGGVYQLVGNVWEWMRGDFTPLEPNEGQWAAEMCMKSIRGGAYDTYFDNQATCQFQSGEAAVARKHNVGFRCAVGVCDLALAPGAVPAAEEGRQAKHGPGEAVSGREVQP